MCFDVFYISIKNCTRTTAGTQRALELDRRERARAQLSKQRGIARRPLAHCAARAFVVCGAFSLPPVVTSDSRLMRHCTFKNTNVNRSCRRNVFSSVTTI
ncbi:hypothetical protein EVAR_40937_1 [Eumeta japonica]|uniref:Uncharacterized protein n=1 Tax=Eumeta variegata TaxID=151549 RepID=A0A4C1X3R7_EUMVA|nr:hypothetical protein EVAR_40937_1 [Eumeta japonica]